MSQLEGCCVERNHKTIIIFALILLFDQEGLGHTGPDNENENENENENDEIARPRLV